MHLCVMNINNGCCGRVSISQAVSSCTVVVAIQKSIGKWKFRPPVESQHLRISFCNLVHVITSGTSPHIQIFGQIGWAGGLPKYASYNTFVTFLTSSLFRSSPQVKSRLWRTRLMAQPTCFRATRCLLGVRMKGGAFWVNMPPQRATNRQF